jgi:hypothetical protein
MREICADIFQHDSAGADKVRNAIRNTITVIGQG